MHGMLQMPRDTDAVTTGYFGRNTLQAVNTWVNSYWTNKIKKNGSDASDPDQGGAQENNLFKAYNDKFVQTQEKIKQYQFVINTFIPEKAGGSLEKCFISKNDDDDEWIADKVPKKQNDEQTQPIDPITSYDNDKVYRVMPGGRIITGKMLFNIIRWPVLLGASEDALFRIISLLALPSEKFGETVTESESEVLKIFRADSKYGITVHDECLLHYKRGQLNFDDLCAFSHLH